MADDTIRFVAWTVIAAVASLLAAACALQAVRQTARLRREARQQILADALIAVISATGTARSADPHVADALRQVERAAGLSILGLSAQLQDPVLGLLEPANRDDHRKLFMYATKAYDELRVENGGAPITQEPSTDSLLVEVCKRGLLRLADLLRRTAQ